MTYEQRHYDGYPRPRRFGLIVSLCLILAGTAWIDLYDVPHGLGSIACAFRITSWSSIISSPRVYWCLFILLAEFAFWIRLLAWLWPVRALARPVISDWLLVILVFLLGAGLLLYAVAAMQPGPWQACLSAR